MTCNKENGTPAIKHNALGWPGLELCNSYLSRLDRCVLVRGRQAGNQRYSPTSDQLGALCQF